MRNFLSLSVLAIISVILVSCNLLTNVQAVKPVVCDPESGMYNIGQLISLTCATEDAEIRYTVDGSEPSLQNGIVYDNPIELSIPCTLKARAYKSGLDPSKTTAETYSIFTVSDPSFLPVGGSYSTPQYININCDTDNSIIRYTDDGTDPTASSPIYSDEIYVTYSVVLKARAYKDGWLPSSIVTSSYEIGPYEPAPTFSPPGGTYNSPQTVTLSHSSYDADIYYTLDGSEPDMTSHFYLGPIFVYSHTIIKAKSNRSYLWSPTSTAEYFFSVNEIGLFSPVSHATDIYISGSYAYLTCGGMYIVNISNPSTPWQTGFSNLPDDARGIHVSAYYAYIADGSNGLRIFDIDNPSSPESVGYCNTPGAGYDVFVVGRYAYVADGYSGLQVIDVIDPSNPTIIGNYDTNGFSKEIYVSGSYAYITDNSNGLQIIDISIPNYPILVCNFTYNPWSPSYCDARDVVISGNLAYVTWDYGYYGEGGGGLSIIDISNPSNPTQVGSYETPGNAADVAVNGNHAFIADGSSVQIIDISNSSNPTYFGSFSSPNHGAFEAISVSGNHVYVSSYSGLLILSY